MRGAGTVAWVGYIVGIANMSFVLHEHCSVGAQSGGALIWPVVLMWSAEASLKPSAYWCGEPTQGPLDSPAQINDSDR